jgi:hypothetical protein
VDFGANLIPIGKIIDSREQGVRHNVKRVRLRVRQLLLRYSNISPNK